MKKLLELEKKLKSARKHLTKMSMDAVDGGIAGQDLSTVRSMVNTAKSEDKKPLKGRQSELDMDKDGDIEADDLAALRQKKKSLKKSHDLNKIMSSSTTVPGSVNTTGKPSIASQIGFGKAEDEPSVKYAGSVKGPTGLVEHKYDLHQGGKKIGTIHHDPKYGEDNHSGVPEMHRDKINSKITSQIKEHASSLNRSGGLSKAEDKKLVGKQKNLDMDKDGDIEADDLAALRAKKMKKAEHPDEKEDKELIAEALDRHNEKKHGEAKDKDSAKKDMGLKKSEEMLVSFPNGQWSILK